MVEKDGNPTTFTNFALGTTHFGLLLANSHQASNGPVQIDVVGVSGSLTLNTGNSFTTGFVGFEDLFGLTSVTFTRLGDPNISFDDVVTASVSVPEPGTLVVFCIGLAGMGLSRRRKQLSQVV